ncbi:unnamed product [Ostreococcus tauri]|uniref:Unnamed product n=1 Tax=Ostreococcus tauri TaxID=70448 RepID=Q012P1_OSTTA|nr:unnamed product [Ostreococcus tauri]CAL55139.1 unnamed product [Ostreococcus tauri]|eukprot:XP_003080971.1 unnamed product [Ostreococcus tauri]
MGCSKCRYSERGCARCVVNFIGRARATTETASGPMTSEMGRKGVTMNSNRSTAISSSEKRKRVGENVSRGIKRGRSNAREDKVGKSGRTSTIGVKTPGMKTPTARFGARRGLASESESTEMKARATQSIVARASETSESDGDGGAKERDGEDDETWEDAPNGRVLFDDCEMPSPKPIEEMSPGAVESVIAKSPSAMRQSTTFINETPPSPLAAAFAMISDFLDSPRRERSRVCDRGDFWGLSAAAG